MTDTTVKFVNKEYDFSYFDSLFKDFEKLVDYKQGSSCTYLAKIAHILNLVEYGKPFTFSSIEEVEDQWTFETDSENPVEANIPISLSTCSDETKSALDYAIISGDYSDVPMRFLRLKFMKLHGDYSFFTIKLSRLPNIKDVEDDLYLQDPYSVKMLFQSNLENGEKNPFFDFLTSIDYKEEVYTPPVATVPEKVGALKSWAAMTAKFLKKKGVINEDVEELVEESKLEESKVQQTYDLDIQTVAPQTEAMPSLAADIEQEIATEKPTLETLKQLLTPESIDAEVEATEALAAVEKIPEVIKVGETLILEPRVKSKTSLVTEENSRTEQKSEHAESIKLKVADKELVSKSGKIKPNMCLIDPQVQRNLAAVLTWGKQKYPANSGFNYSLGSNTTDYLDAALRHISEIVQCQEIDSESGMHHVYHAMANLNMWASNMENKAFTEETRNPIYLSNLIPE